MSRAIEFVSYDGEYPHLCTGTLVLSIDGKEYGFNCLCSGGSVEYEEDDYVVYTGEWKLDHTEISKGIYVLEAYNNKYPHDVTFSEDEIAYITSLVNQEVEQGCCGGCI